MASVDRPWDTSQRADSGTNHGMSTAKAAGADVKIAKCLQFDTHNAM